jgi:hypothetical protein
MQSAHSLSGPVQLVGRPSHVTIGQAHDLSQAASQAAIDSSSPPQELKLSSPTSANEITTRDRFMDAKYGRHASLIRVVDIFPLVRASSLIEVLGSAAWSTPPSQCAQPRADPADG